MKSLWQILVCNFFLFVLFKHFSACNLEYYMMRNTDKLAVHSGSYSVFTGVMLPFYFHSLTLCILVALLTHELLFFVPN